MTFPIDISFGNIVIPSHALFELLAFFIGYRYFLYIRRSKTQDILSPYAETMIIIGMAVGAFVGSRLIASLENLELFMNPTSLLYYFASQTIAGGIIGGFIGVEIVKKIMGINRKTGDLFVYPLILGIIIGRIGCFLKGVSDGTVGNVSNLPWAFDQGDGLPRHPTSLYEILFLILIWIFLKWIEKSQILKNGDLFSVFMLLYLLFRVFVEFIKPFNSLVLNLSSIQIFSVLVVIYYCLYFIKRYKS
jgi:prolipoprotein diacylglyceryltransferase